MHTTPDRILNKQVHGISVCFIQIHKTGEDFTLSGCNTTQTSLRKKRTATEVKTGEGRAKLTANSLSDLLMGYRTKRWSIRERDSHSKGERDRHTRQFYLCKLIFTWSDWLVCYLSICHEAGLLHSRTHTRLKHSTQTAHQTHTTLKSFTSCFVTLGASLPSDPSGDCWKCNKESRLLPRVHEDLDF